MTAPDLTNLTADELRRIAIGDGTTADDPYAAVDELHRRAQANDRLRSAAQAVLSWLNGEALEQYPSLAAEATHDVEPLRCNLETALAAAPAAPPTPAATVTDAEIEAAITALTVDARREADALRVNPEASGTATEKRANRQVQLRALIARRVASAGAAPVDSEREAAIEAWRGVAMQDSMDEADNYDGFTPTKEDVGTPDELFALRREEIDEAVRLMRSARPAPAAGDQDAKLRELRARLLSTAASLPNRQMGHSDEDFDRGYVEACENWAQEIDRLLAAPAAPAGDQDAKLREAVEALETVATKQQKVEIRDAAHRILRGYSPCTNCGKWMHRSECHWPCNPIAPVAAPAASAIAAAPEAPKREPWEERFRGVEGEMRGHSKEWLEKCLLALRDGLSSHARRIEALERAAQEGSK